MMQIIMNQVEIETAITDFVSRQINISTDQEITIELQATRGANGYTATLGIMPRIGGAPTPVEDAPGVEPTKAAEPKAAPKPIAKATLGIAIGSKKPSGLLLKAQAEAEESEPETSTQAYTGEDDGADDEVTNTLAGSSSRDDEPPMNETEEDGTETEAEAPAAAPSPRSIFSKAKTG